jgi:hypothetical protein
MVRHEIASRFRCFAAFFSVDSEASESSVVEALDSSIFLELHPPSLELGRFPNKSGRGRFLEALSMVVIVDNKDGQYNLEIDFGRDSLDIIAIQRRMAAGISLGIVSVQDSDGW